VKNAHVGSVPGMREYIAEFTSEKAIGEYGYLAEKGLIPAPKAQREKYRKAALTLAPLDLAAH
jgi:phosphate transport system substrate-binding protein